MTTTQQQLPDLRPALLRSLEVLDSLITTTGADDAGRPTPCTEFDVQALVDHLVLVVRRVRIVCEGGAFTDAVPTGSAAYDEVRAAWASDLAALRAAMPAFDLTRTVTAPFGTAPTAVMLGMYVSETAVHAWDLAAALGHTDLLDPTLAEPLVAVAHERIPRERDQIPFGEVVEVPDDAPAYDRLLGWYGRDPRWTA
jgi:uncharacterized protein (TIGR03086 family)